MRRWGHTVAVATAGASLLFLLLVRLQAVTLRNDVVLPSSTIHPDSGHAFFVEVGFPDGDSLQNGALSHVELREDGRRLGPAHAAHHRIRSQGGGAFSHWERRLYFSTSDGSDPRSNGRRYTAGVPWVQPDALLVATALLLAILGWRRLHGWLARADAAHPIWGLLTVMAVATVYRIYVASAHADDTHSFLVKGMPVSDARGWDFLTIEFSQGRRWSSEMIWDAHRPLYWIFMGSLYALFGPSVAVVQATHMVIGVVAVGLVFEATRRMTSSLFATIVALSLALSLSDALTALTPGTEPLGAFLSCVSLFFLVLGAERLTRPHPAFWPLAASGSALALANLARPLNLLAAGAIPFVLLWIAGRRPPASAGRRVALRGAGLFVAAVALTLAPWIVRQRVVHGIWTLSANTSEMTYAVTSPQFGAWTSEVSTLAPSGLSLGERTRFFEKKTLENVAADPGFVLRNVTYHAVRCAGNLPGERWAMFLGVVLLSLRAARKDRGLRALARLGAAGALLCAGIAFLPSTVLCVLWIGGVVLSLARRHLMALPATLLAVSVGSLAMVGLHGGTRFLVSLEWLATAVGLWTCAELLHAARDLTLAPAASDSPPWGRRARPLVAAALLGCGLWLVGLGCALVAHARPAVATPPTVMPAAEAAAWIAAVLDRPEAGAYASLRPRLEVREGVIRRGYRAHFSAGETAEHWNPLFNGRRSYAADVFEVTWHRVENLATSFRVLYTVFPGDVRPLAGTEVVLVGIPMKRPAEGSSFEAIALIPRGPSPAPILFAPPDVRPAHAADLARLAGIRSSDTQ